MITALDTSVLLDVFGADPVFGPAAKQAVRVCLAQGRLVACDPVWAETASFFPSARAARGAMSHLGVAFDPLQVEAALGAATAWRAYRKRGGQRERVVADFLIGAHALQQADRLLTRDRGFYRSYFARLSIIDPAKP